MAQTFDEQKIGADDLGDPASKTASPADDPPRPREGGPHILWRKKSDPASVPDDDGAQEYGDSVNTTESTPDWETKYKEELAKAESYFAQWQRAQADMANVRRRAQQDKEEIIKFSTQALVADLLPVLDSFDGALATIPDTMRDQPWISGILQVERQLRAALERQGLKPIEATGQPFDPTKHESIGHEETTDYPEDTVSAELRKGYTLNDRVLRPSMVRVATSP